MDQKIKLQQYSLEGKTLFGYSSGTDVFVTVSELVSKFGLQRVPTATLQRKKRAITQGQGDRYCPAAYLKLFKSAHAVGECARKVSVITLTQAQALLQLLAGRKLKQIGATPERMESTPEKEDARMQPVFHSPLSSTSPAISHSHHRETECAAETGEKVTSEETSHPAGVQMETEIESTHKLTSERRSRAKSQRVTHKELKEALDAMKRFYLTNYSYKRDGRQLSEVTVERTLETIRGMASLHVHVCIISLHV